MRSAPLPPPPGPAGGRPDPGGPPATHSRVMRRSPRGWGPGSAGKAALGRGWRTKTHPFSLTFDSIYRTLSERVTQPGLHGACPEAGLSGQLLAAGRRGICLKGKQTFFYKCLLEGWRAGGSPRSLSRNLRGLSCLSCAMSTCWCKLRTGPTISLASATRPSRPHEPCHPLAEAKAA